MVVSDSDYNLVVRAVNLLSAAQPYHFSIPWTPVTLTGGDLVLPPTTVPDPFPDSVNYGTLDLDWHFSQNGGSSWSPAGRTHNELYVTLAAPTISPVYHTPIHLAIPIAASVAAADESTLIAKAWENYSGKSLTTKHLKPNDPGVPLTYYAEWNTEVIRDEKLLEDKDGQCGAFAYLLRRSLREAGVTTTPIVAINISPKEVIVDMVINNWDIPGAGAGGLWTHKNETSNASFPTDGPPNNMYRKVGNKWEYFWGPNPQTADQEGVEGQGNVKNPKAIFSIHTIVKVGAKYYDPSYGTGPYDNVSDWEQASVKGFCKAMPDNVTAKWHIHFRKDAAAQEVNESTPPW